MQKAKRTTESVKLWGKLKASFLSRAINLGKEQLGDSSRILKKQFSPLI